MATVLRLDASARTLLALMAFPEIPETANYIAFLDDGPATFFEDFQGGFNLPRFAILRYYPDVELQLS